METICVKVKIKQGSIDQVRTWFKTLKARSQEVLESLKAEDVVIESIFLDTQNSDHYLIYYMKAKNLTHAREVANKSLLSIDKYHRECRKNFCEESHPLELLADFENFTSL